MLKDVLFKLETSVNPLNDPSEKILKILKIFFLRPGREKGSKSA